MLGPVRSASINPTFAPNLRRAIARFTATVDLPTPPLFDARQGFQQFVRLLLHRLAHGTGRSRQDDPHRDARATDVNIGLRDEPKANDIAMQIGILYLAKRCEDRLLTHLAI